MEKYGFQGADLDWEYPEDAKRGGRPGDADNLVLLVQEMQAAFAGRFGLSLTLAPDYWYLRGFKPKAMEPYVDFMGFMRYTIIPFTRILYIDTNNDVAMTSMGHGIPTSRH